MKEKKFIKHGINLVHVSVRELSFKAFDGDNTLKPPSTPKFFTAKSEYDKENHSVSLGILVKLGEESDCRYTSTVEIVGVFTVDESKFEISKLDDWSEYNAPYILHPYLRMHLYKLTLECTGEGYMLPLVEVPTSGRRCESQV